ncbi:MAG: hypothetical protein R2828_32300 [Saprospiraceae bacterium]
MISTTKKTPEDMFKRLTFLATIAVFLMLQACNPDCVNLSTANISLPPGPYLQGSEMAISASPSSLIKEREFHLSLKKNNSTEITLLPSRFEEQLDAAVVTLPNQINASATFLINDPDCTGNLIPIGTPTSLQSASFFVDNPFFVTPAPPLIVIPSPPPSIPGNIVNAWFSPNDRNYCIWFSPDKDASGNELPTLTPGFFLNTERMGSWELAAGCSNASGTGSLYHLNPVSGIVDKTNNIISIRVDRTSKNLGIEEFEGFFIDPTKVPLGADYNIGGVCNPDGAAKPKLMYLVSQKTGRQMILWRGAD